MKILMESCQRSLHDLVQVLITRSSGDPGEILSQRSLHRSLQMPCLRGACMKALVGGSWEVLGRFLGGSCIKCKQQVL